MPIVQWWHSITSVLMKACYNKSLTVLRGNLGGVLAAIAFVLCSMLQGLGAATTFTWNTSTSGNFSTAGNWTPSGPPGNNDIAAFGATGLGSSTITVSLTANETVQSLLFTNATPYVLQGAFTLTANVGGENLTMNASADMAINTSTFEIKQNSVFGGTGTGVLTVGGALTSSKTLDKQGSFTLKLSGNNSSTMSGAITVSGGTLLVASSGALGSGGVTLSGTGTLKPSTTTTTTGALTLTSGFIDYSTSGGQVMTFGSIAATPTATISGWREDVGDQLVISGGTLPSGIITTLKFNSPYYNGIQYSGLYSAIMSGNQIVPYIPEPSTWAALVGLGGLVAWRERKRFSKR